MPDRKQFSVTQRVRYAETDAMGVAWHGSYLLWFEVGRVELLLGESFHRGAQIAGRLRDLLELRLFLLRRGWAFEGELADGVAQIRHKSSALRL